MQVLGQLISPQGQRAAEAAWPSWASTKPSTSAAGAQTAPPARFLAAEPPSVAETPAHANGAPYSGTHRAPGQLSGYALSGAGAVQPPGTAGTPALTSGAVYGGGFHAPAAHSGFCSSAGAPAPPVAATPQGAARLPWAGLPSPVPVGGAEDGRDSGGAGHAAGAEVEHALVPYQDPASESRGRAVDSRAGFRSGQQGFSLPERSWGSGSGRSASPNPVWGSVTRSAPKVMGRMAPGPAGDPAEVAGNLATPASSQLPLQSPGSRDPRIGELRISQESWLAGASPSAGAARDAAEGGALSTPCGDPTGSAPDGVATESGVGADNDGGSRKVISAWGGKGEGGAGAPLGRLRPQAVAGAGSPSPGSNARLGRLAGPPEVRSLLRSAAAGTALSAGPGVPSDPDLSPRPRGIGLQQLQAVSMPSCEPSPLPLPDPAAAPGGGTGLQEPWARVDSFAPSGVARAQSGEAEARGLCEPASGGRRGEAAGGGPEEPPGSWAEPGAAVCEVAGKPCGRAGGGRRGEAGGATPREPPGSWADPGARACGATALAQGSGGGSRAGPSGERREEGAGHPAAACASDGAAGEARGAAPDSAEAEPVRRVPAHSECDADTSEPRGSVPADELLEEGLGDPGDPGPDPGTDPGSVLGVDSAPGKPRSSAPGAAALSKALSGLEDAGYVSACSELHDAAPAEAPCDPADPQGFGPCGPDAGAPSELPHQKLSDGANPSPDPGPAQGAQPGDECVFSPPPDPAVAEPEGSAGGGPSPSKPFSLDSVSRGTAGGEGGVVRDKTFEETGCLAGIPPGSLLHGKAAQGRLRPAAPGAAPGGGSNGGGSQGCGPVAEAGGLPESQSARKRRRDPPTDPANLRGGKRARPPAKPDQARNGAGDGAAQLQHVRPAGGRVAGAAEASARGHAEDEPQGDPQENPGAATEGHADRKRQGGPQKGSQALAGESVEEGPLGMPQVEAKASAGGRARPQGASHGATQGPVRASARVRVQPLAYWANQSLRRDQLNGDVFSIHAGFPDQLARAATEPRRAAPRRLRRVKPTREPKDEPGGSGGAPANNADPTRDLQQRSADSPPAPERGAAAAVSGGSGGGGQTVRGRGHPRGSTQAASVATRASSGVSGQVASGVSDPGPVPARPAAKTRARGSHSRRARAHPDPSYNPKPSSSTLNHAPLPGAASMKAAEAKGREAGKQQGLGSHPEPALGLAAAAAGAAAAAAAAAAPKRPRDNGTPATATTAASGRKRKPNPKPTKGVAAVGGAASGGTLAGGAKTSGKPSSVTDPEPGWPVCKRARVTADSEGAAAAEADAAAERAAPRPQSPGQHERATVCLSRLCTRL